MKQIAFFFSLCFFAPIMEAQKIAFQTSLSATFEKAQSENKLVFVEYYSSTCSHCTKLEPFFKDSILVAFYNSHFVSYKLNTENIKAEDKAFLDKMGLHPDATPIFLFFDKNQQLNHFSNTKTNRDYLIEIAKTALDPLERSSNLANKYKSGDRTIKTLYAYSNFAQLYKQDSLVDVLADDLFKAFPSQNLGTKKSYTILKNCVFSIENGFFKYWVTHIEQIKALDTESKAEVNKTPTPVKKDTNDKIDLANIVQHVLNRPESKNWGLAKIKEVKNLIRTVALSDNPDSFFWQREIPLLIEAHRNEEALDLCKRLLTYEKTNQRTGQFYISQFLIFFTEKKDLETLDKILTDLNLSK